MKIEINSEYINLINDKIPHTGKFNMSLDERIYNFVKEKKINPVLRIYEWEHPTITYGKFQKPEQFDIEKCNKEKIEIIKRPTGGRAILHQNEITFSFSIYNKHITPYTFRTLFVYIAEHLIKTFKSLNIYAKINLAPTHYESSASCFNSISQYEIVDKNNNKLAGIAQYFTTTAALIQGSIPLEDNSIIKNFFKDKTEIQQLKNQLIDSKVSRDELRNSLIKNFSKKLKIIDDITVFLQT